MRDVTEQMTAYFDATVERVTAEDVLAGADVRSQNGRFAAAPAPRLRPVALRGCSNVNRATSARRRRWALPGMGFRGHGHW